jgi:hypothetical protein
VEAERYASSSSENGGNYGGETILDKGPSLAISSIPTRILYI